MRIKVRSVHPCEKPNIPVVDHTVNRTGKTWYGKRIVKSKTVHSYVYDNAEWECGVCGAEWAWTASGMNGYWWCVRGGRTQRKEVDV